MSAVNRYWGKHRGKVRNNLDPLALGRLQVNVPAVPGLSEGWAMPCVPYAGRGVGFYVIPPVGANVWVEFEGGDPNYPIWAGCFWEEGEVPGEPAVPEKKVWKTQSITMVLNDIEGEGGFSLTVSPPVVEEVMSITINATGITLSCPESTVKMTPEMVEIAVPEATVTVSAETITLSLPESTLSLSPETLEITVPPSTITLTAELLELAIPASTISMTEEAMEIESTAVSVTGAIELSPEVSVSGTFEVEGNSSLLGTVEIEGPNLNVTAITEITGAVAITGAVEVTGGMLIDGLVPMMLP
jgi:hypothetical protein